jgi:hypothetical protein
MPYSFTSSAPSFISVNVTAASRTLLLTETGTTFTNRGAGAGTTYTLPPTAAQCKGAWFGFYTQAAQAITVASSPADTLTVHADLTADTIATGAVIGQHLLVWCDGTSWNVISDPSAASAATAVTAVTIAT